MTLREGKPESVPVLLEPWAESAQDCGICVECLSTAIAVHQLPLTPSQTQSGPVDLTVLGLWCGCHPMNDPPAPSASPPSLAMHPGSWARPPRAN